MEALIVAIIIAYAIKKGVEAGQAHWQSSKAANRTSTRGRSVPKRAASAVQHDVGYWLHRVLNGFPETRHALASGWTAGRTAQAQGAADRQKAKAEHLTLRARLLPEIREHQRRQAEALELIQAARRQCLHAPTPCMSPTHCSCRCPDCDETALPEPQPQSPNQQTATEGTDMTSSPDWVATEDARLRADAGAPPQVPLSTTKGNAMPSGTPSGDTTYTQQMREFTAIRDDAEAEVNSVRVKRMMNHLDILTSLGLDSASLAEAAAIDDALLEQQKAAQNTLDAADAAIQGLKTRHGGIKQAVDDSPVDQSAQPEFYSD